MSLQRVIIIHGYGASPADHWFGSLAEALRAQGVEVDIPQLPDPLEPDLQQWTDAAVEAIGTPDAGTAVVSHSLGVVTALHALDRVPGEWRLGAFVGVAGFLDPLPSMPALDVFTATAPDAARTAERTAARLVLHSDEDPYVPTALTLRLAETLDAETIAVPGAGHFLAGEGVTELPQVAERLVRA